MVLSNKKLKEILRKAKAESLSETNPTNVQDPNSKPQESLKSLLNSVTQKPRLSKRDKRRENSLSKQDGKKSQEESGAVGMSEQKKEQKKKKKRKRDEAEGLEKENGEVNQDKKPIKKKKKKKNKKTSKGKQKVEAGEVKNVGDGVNVEAAAAPSKSDERNTPVCSIEESGDISNKVYVGGIPYYSTEDDIRSYFEGCGTITEVDCMIFPDSGKFRGIAIITFKTEAAAKRALALDGSDMGGLFLKIQSYKSSTKANKVSNFQPNIVEGYNRVYVGNLSWDVTEDDLKKLFTDCKIGSIRFGEDKETGEFRGYAHVDFTDSLSVNVALKLDQRIVCGRPVRISRAVALKRPATKNENTDSVIVATSTVSGKIRRRICYDCGERGHLSSACPKNQETNPTEQAAS